jgi:hypothetical protein
VFSIYQNLPYTTNDEVLNRLGLTKDGKLKNAAAVLFCGFPDLGNH